MEQAKIGKFIQAMRREQSLTQRELSCPHCGKRSYCKKHLTKE